MTTNSLYRFYWKLYDLLFAGADDFDQQLAEQIVAIYDAEPEVITLEHITLDVLRGWYQIEISYRAGEGAESDRNGIELHEKLMRTCFADLSNQLKNRKIRELVRMFQFLDLEILIHFRKVVDLGDGFVAATLVTNNAEWIRAFTYEEHDGGDEFIDNEYLHVTLPKK